MSSYGDQIYVQVFTLVDLGQ